MARIKPPKFLWVLTGILALFSWCIFIPGVISAEEGQDKEKPPESAAHAESEKKDTHETTANAESELIKDDTIEANPEPAKHKESTAESENHQPEVKEEAPPKNEDHEAKIEIKTEHAAAHEEHEPTTDKHESAEKKGSAEASLPAPPDKVDAVLVLDASASMLLTDPENLRYQGAKKFLQYLSKDDRVGIITFSKDARTAWPLGTWNPSQAEDVISKVASVPTEGTFTDLLAGVKAAKLMIEKDQRENARRVIILLSDGKMEPDPSIGTAEARTTELLSSVLPELKSKEIKVHTLSFSDQADKDLLSEIAATSDGVSWYTPTVDDISKSFESLFLVVKRPQVLPVTKRGFRVDAAVLEATFYVNHEDGVIVKLTDPDQQEHTAAKHPEFMRWYTGPKFDVITVDGPTAGDWEATGITSTESFATVLTSLKLVADWPDSVRVDDKILVQARLYDADKPIVLPEMSEVIQYAFQISPTDKISEPIFREFLVDDGTKGDKAARDGIFTYEVTMTDPGEYKLSVVARAPTFQRTQQIPFRVKPRLVVLRAAKIHHDQGEFDIKDEHEDEHQEHEAPLEKGGADIELEISLSPEVTTFKSLEVKLIAVDKEKHRYNLPLEKGRHDPTKYTFPVSGLPADGVYKLQAFVVGETKRREEVRGESSVLTFERVHGGESTEKPELMVVEQKKPPEPPKPFPWLALILVTIINVALSVGALFMLKKLQTSSMPDVPPYVVPPDISDAVAAMEKLVVETEIDLNNSMFANLEDAPPGEAAAPPPSADKEAAPAPAPEAEGGPAES